MIEVFGIRFYSMKIHCSDTYCAC